MASKKAEASDLGGVDELEPPPSGPALPTAATQALFEASGYELAVHPAHIIRRAHQRATMCFQEVMGAEHDLTPTQMGALATIMKHGELSQNQLGRMTAMDPSTISIVIRKLVKLGLVDRSASADDQRLSILRLTEAGIRHTAPLLAKSVEVGRRVLAPLKPSERALFMEMLFRVADGADETSPEA